MSKITENKIEFETFDNAAFAAPIKQAPIPEQLFIPLPKSGELIFPYKAGEKLTPNSPVLKAKNTSSALPIFLPCEATAIGVGVSEHPVYGRKKYAIVKTGTPIPASGNTYQVQNYNINSLIRLSFAAGIRGKSDRPLFSELMSVGHDAIVCDCTDSGPYCFSACKQLFTYPKELTTAISIIVSAMNIKGKEIIFNLAKNFYSKIPMFLNGVRITNLLDQTAKDTLAEQLSAFGYKNPLMLSPASLISLYNSIVLGIPETYGVISIYDVKHKKGGLARIPYGGMLSDILHSLGYKTNKRTAYINNPLLGQRVTNFKFPYIGGINSIVLTDNSPKNLECCVGCGRCDEICPAGIYPSLIVSAPRRFLGKTDTIRATDCTECRLCSYVCPTDFNIAELIIKTKEGDTGETTEKE